MARVIWKGSISFGLVEIPVTLKPAENRDEISFHQLDSRDNAPVGYKRVNKKTGKEVAWSEIVKGYEYEKDEYVLLDESELRAAAPKMTRTVDIIEFIDADELEPVLFETPYYLEPAKKGSKGYALLRELLKKEKKVGIAKVVLHARQYLAALMVRGPALVLNLLRFAHELRDPEELDVPGEDLTKLGVTKKEVEMAHQLVEGMKGKLHLQEFKNDYRDALQAMIERKVKSGETQAVEVPEGKEDEGRGKVIDLMSLLKQSLAAAKSHPGGGAEAGHAAAKPPARRATTARRRTSSTRRGATTTRRAATAAKKKRSTAGKRRGAHK